MKSLSEVQTETFGRVYTLDEFIDDVCDGYLTPYDGIGFFHDGEGETKIDVWSIKTNDDIALVENYPYVVWYNK